MKANEITVGGVYEAKVSGKLTRVRVDRIEDGYTWQDRPVRRYHVTNLVSGRKTVFRSAAKFRRVVQPNRDTQAVREQIKGQLGILLDAGTDGVTCDFAALELRVASQLSVPPAPGAVAGG